MDTIIIIINLIAAGQLISSRPCKMSSETNALEVSQESLDVSETYGNENIKQNISLSSLTDSGYETSKELSRNTSYASVTSGDTSQDYSKPQHMQSFNEKEQPGKVKIVIQNESSKEHSDSLRRISREVIEQDVRRDSIETNKIYLDVPMHRKTSTSSISSNSSYSSMDDYVTAPSSPRFNRSISDESTSSTRDTFIVELGMTIQFKLSQKRTTLSSIDIRPNSLRIRRSHSSPASSPNSPCSTRRHILVNEVSPSPQQNQLLWSCFTEQSKVPKSSFQLSSQLQAKLGENHTTEKHRKDLSPQLPPHLSTNEYFKLENECIQRIVQRNMVEFVQSTNLKSLCAHLIEEELISHDDYEEIEGRKTTREKNNFFYMMLRNKGLNAYIKLYKCLRCENEHCGHKDLVKIIEMGLQKEKKYMSPE